MVCGRRVIILVMAVALLGIGALVFSLPKRSEPSIRLGVDKCAVCQMVIVDKRFAAMYYDGSRWEKFDDVICLLQYLGEGGNFENAYVHDYLSGKLIKASEAYYVITKRIPTPMGSGIVAFENMTDALAYSDDGRVYTIGELRERVKP